MRNLLRVHFDAANSVAADKLAKSIAHVLSYFSEERLIPTTLYLQSSSKSEAMQSPILASVERLEKATLEQLQCEDFPEYTIASFWGEYEVDASFLVNSVFSQKMKNPHFLNLKVPTDLTEEILSVLPEFVSSSGGVHLVALRNSNGENSDFYVFGRNGDLIEGDAARNVYDKLYLEEQKLKRRAQGKSGF